MILPDQVRPAEIEGLLITGQRAAARLLWYARGQTIRLQLHPRETAR